MGTCWSSTRTSRRGRADAVPWWKCLLLDLSTSCASTRCLDAPPPKPVEHSRDSRVVVRLEGVLIWQTIAPSPTRTRLSAWWRLRMTRAPVGRRGVRSNPNGIGRLSFVCVCLPLRCPPGRLWWQQQQQQQQQLGRDLAGFSGSNSNARCSKSVRLACALLSLQPSWSHAVAGDTPTPCHAPHAPPPPHTTRQRIHRG